MLYIDWSIWEEIVKRILVAPIILWMASAAPASESSFTKDPTLAGGLYFYGPAEEFTYNLYYSDDFGENLQIVVADTNFEGGLIADAVPGYLINHDGVIKLSRDYGVTWEWTGVTPSDIVAGRYQGEMYTFDYVGSDPVIKYSLNYGESWELHYPVGLVETSSRLTIGNLPGEIYILNLEEGGIYRSIDYGDTLTYMSTLQISGGGYGTRLDAGALPGELYFYDGYTGDLFFSADSGISFQWKYNFPDTASAYYVTQMQAGIESGDVFVFKSRIYYEGGGEIFVYYSSDYGEHFTEFHPFSTTAGIAVKSPTQPANHELSIYPNPCNSTTVITFQLSHAGVVRLQFLDIMGRNALTFQPRFITPGSHKFILNGTGLASGVYYCNVQIGDQNVVLPIVYQK
jgi:hypothetical protein